MRSSAAEWKRFCTKMAFYEEGEKTGRLLTKTARSQQSSSAIGAVRSATGWVVRDLDQIVTELASFYCDLYSSQYNYPIEALTSYLYNLSLPTLSSEACLALDTPISLDELQKVVCSFPTCKASGDDGLPMEVYTKYGETILPKLL